MKNRQISLQFRTAILLVSVAVLSSLSYPQQTGAQNQEAGDKTLSPYFFVKGDPAVDHLPLKSTDVDIGVSGVIADVRVKQVYANEGSRPINATYVFPASTRAAVYSMRMKIGDEIIYAKIKEREKAKQEFEKAKKEGKSASLLEEDRPNVFTMSLANIMPQNQIEIELRYTELLVPTDGVYEVVYPTVVGPRYASRKERGDDGTERWIETLYLKKGEGPPSSLHINTRVAAGMPIRQLACASHQISPEWQDPGSARLTLDEPDAFQGNRDFVLRYRLSGDKMTSGLLLFKGDGDGENFFLYMAQPPERVAEADIPPREYIFLVDVSGSMEGFPIATAKRLFSDLTATLRPTDLFNVVLFSGDSTLLSPRSLEANPANIATAVELLEQQRGSGGTELLAGLKQAMSLPRGADVSRSIVVITDGYISGESEAFEHIRANRGKANVFSFGIGSSVNRYLVDGVAKAGMGEPFVVTNEAEAAEVAAKFREYIQNPVLTDVKIQAEGFETYDVEPGQFPDLLARRPVVLYGKWRGKPSGTFELTGANGKGAYRDTFDITSVVPDEGNSALRYLWARSRIAEVSDYGADYLPDEKVREVTDLGLKYSLLTRYTSFIAVREKIVNPDGSARDVNQPLPLPVGVSELAVGDEPDLIWLIAACGLIALIVLMRRRLLTGDLKTAA
jgi:Ca-activated chloride channel family protein